MIRSVTDMWEEIQTLAETLFVGDAERRKKIVGEIAEVKTLITAESSVVECARVLGLRPRAVEALRTRADADGVTFDDDEDGVSPLLHFLLAPALVVEVVFVAALSALRPHYALAAWAVLIAQALLIGDLKPIRNNWRWERIYQVYVLMGLIYLLAGTLLGNYGDTWNTSPRPLPRLAPAASSRSTSAFTSPASETTRPGPSSG